MRRAHVPALATLVGASFILRMVLGWLRAAPALFPDEYTYAALGRSLAETGRPLIRGASPHFPALLQPLVTAPAWLVGEVGLAYRLVQTIGALSMSLAAIPVFLLARRLGLSVRIALAAAALAVVVPDLVYASFVSSEALAYPLVLGAVYAATAALARPARRPQLAFVALATLATLARVQFAVLPLVFLAAALSAGLRERRTRAALREQLLPLGLFALAALVLVAAGPARTLGPYRAALGMHGDPLAVTRWAALDAMTLAYASGWILVPGALLGLWLALRRPRSREELVFGAIALLLAGALLVEAGLLQASLDNANEIQERYVFYLVPLLGLCFVLYAARGWPLRLPHLALAAALVLVSVRLPLSGYAVAATVDGSPILYGVYWLGGVFGESGAAASAVALSAALLSLGAVVASQRPRLGTPVALGLALLAAGAASAGAVAFDVTNSGLAKRTFLPADPSWVDRARLGSVTLVQARGGIRAASLQELFWNRSLEHVVLLPGAGSIDRFRDRRARVGDDGSLIVDGRPLAGPLLIDGYGSTVRLRGAYRLDSGPTAALWAPRGRPRLSLYAIGRYYDGWLSDAGAVYLWPESSGGSLSGQLTMTLTAPRPVGAATLRFTLPAGRTRVVRLRPGVPQHVSLPVCSRGSWYATFRANVHGLVGLRPVSVRATPAVFTAGPRSQTCPLSGPAI